MTTINCNGYSQLNLTKCHGLAGPDLQGDKCHSNVYAIENTARSYESNSKYQSYYIPSKRYYGILPIIPQTNDCAMETNEIESYMINGMDKKNSDSVEIGVLRNAKSIDGIGLPVGVTSGRRKRNSGEDNYTEGQKKQRKEVRDSVIEKDGESSQPFIRGCDLDLEDLLKETHGCDMYHFYRYDL